jgi:hypothetical protein
MGDAASPPLLPGQTFDVEAAEKALTYQAIVRDLAGGPDPRSNDRDGCCGLCCNTTEHTDWCAWRRARELFPDA